MPSWKILKEAGLLPDADAAEQEARPESEDNKMEGVETNTAGLSESGSQAVPKNGETTESQTKVSPIEAELRKTLVFDDELAKLGRQGATRKVLRYQINPRANWGPLTKASRN